MLSFFVSLDIMWKNSIAAICFCTRRIWLLKQKVLKVYQHGKKFLKPIFSSLFLKLAYLPCGMGPVMQMSSLQNMDTKNIAF